MLTHQSPSLRSGRAAGADAASHSYTAAAKKAKWTRKVTAAKGDCIEDLYWDAEETASMSLVHQTQTKNVISQTKAAYFPLNKYLHAGTFVEAA